MFPEEKRWLPRDEHLLVAVPHMSSGACPASPRVHMLRKERGHQHSINTFGLLLDCTSRGVPSRSFLSARVHSRSSHCCPALLHMFGYCPCCSSRGTRNRNTMTKKHLYSKKKKKNLIDDKTSSQLGVIDILVYYIENIIQLYMVIQRKILGLDLCIQSSSSSSDDWKWSGARPSQQRPPTAAHYSEKYISNIITGNSLYYASSSNGFLFQERAASFFSHFQNWIYSIIYIDLFF